MFDDVREIKQPWWTKTRKRAAALTSTFILIMIMVIIVVFVSKQPHTGPANVPRNLIIMIANGMGPAHLAYARTLTQSENKNNTLVMDSILSGTIRTRSANSLISDAAASATAYACGIKTKNRRIGKDVDSNDCGTLLEAAKKKGMRTAIVSSDVTFASSAAFVSHVADRGDYTDIAEQMLDWKRIGEKDIYGRDITFGVDLILGGGRRVFTDKNERVLSKAIEMGYTYTTNMTDFLAEKDVEVHTKEVNLPLLGLFDDEHIDYEVDRNKDETPNLAELTRRGLEIMERASNGFIMVVSGHGIQSACLQGDPGALYGELLSWDAAVAEAVNFIKEKSIETLLLVLSDLDTAGLTLAYPGESTWDPRAVLDQRGSIESIVQKIAERHYNETELEQLVEQRLGITLVSQERDLVEANQDNATSLYPVLSTMVTKRAKITWSSTSNTGQDVNMFVHGRGAEEFKGNLDNAQISRMLDGLMTMKVEEITAHLNGQDSTVKK